jgi:hypothetical protein
MLEHLTIRHDLQRETWLVTPRNHPDMVLTTAPTEAHALMAAEAMEQAAERDEL